MSSAEVVSVRVGLTHLPAIKGLNREGSATEGLVEGYLCSVQQV